MIRVPKTFAGLKKAFDRLGTYCVPSSQSPELLGDALVAPTTVLGLGAAGAAIAEVVFSPGTNAFAITGFLLASSSLASLTLIKRHLGSTNSRRVFGINIAAWQAVGFYTAATGPAVGISIIAAAGLAALAGTRKKSDGNSVITVQNSEEHVGARAESSALVLAYDGNVRQASNSFEPNLLIGEKFVDRIHIADRVAFLRALSAIKSGDTSATSLSVRLNRNGIGFTQQFETMDLGIVRHDSASVRIEKLADELRANESQTPAGQNQNVLAVVSHELRTPLNAIIGFSDVLKSELSSQMTEANRAEYARLINDAGNHLLSLVNTILDVSKIEAGSYTIHPDDFSFEDTAHECVSMLNEQASHKGLLINERYSLDDDSCFGDRRAVKQIIINLLANAIKFTDAGGVITIDANQTDEGLLFEVSDTGIGMDQDMLSEIGKPFTQVDNAYNRRGEGTGLGLSLINGLVGLHGGNIEIKSEQGVGTRVCVFIPAASTKSSAIAQPANPLVALASFAARSKDETRMQLNKEVAGDERRTG